MKLHTRLLLLAVTLLAVSCNNRTKSTQTEAYTSPAPAFCADSAMAYAQRQCDFGPRTMGSEAHEACGQWVADQLRLRGAEVTTQPAVFTLYDGTRVAGYNIIATFRSDSVENDSADGSRLMLCAHWDSRPWADNDPDEAHWRTPVLAANDGASGVAVLLELARMFEQKRPSMTVDIVLFDAEDCGTPDFDNPDGADTEHTWCLGSQHWASQPHTSPASVRFAVLLDMVGSEQTVFRKEGFSQRYAPAVLDKVWAAAQRMGHSSLFSFDAGSYVTDDHLPVNGAGVPCIDLVGGNADGSGFPATWHTIDDNMQHLSLQTLQGVGETVADVVYSERP